MSSKDKNLSDYKDLSLDVGQIKRIGIVVSEWNEEVTGRLARAAIDTLREKGLQDEQILVKYVPGTFELALGAKMMMEELIIDAVICLGCVIQGETRHFEFISQAAANAIAQVGLEFTIPVIFGVLTTDTMEQALDRSGGKYGNKGVEAAITALKMLALEMDLEREGDLMLEDDPWDDEDMDDPLDFWINPEKN